MRPATRCAIWWTPLARDRYGRQRIFVDTDAEFQIHPGAETIIERQDSSSNRNNPRGYNIFGDNSDYNLLTYGEGGIYSSMADLFNWD